jgi:hypothetical protein
VFTLACIPEVERLIIGTFTRPHFDRGHQSPTRQPWALNPAPKLVSHQSPFSSGDPSRKARSKANSTEGLLMLPHSRNTCRLSFEMIRALVERLPMMIAPKWVAVLAQPLGINDLLQYLIAACDLNGQENQIFEIGGPDRVSYGDLMREYARQRGLRRLVIRVPLLTPRLSSLWLGLVTPLYARIGRKLIDSIRNPTVVCDDSAMKAFTIRPMGVREAIARALRNEDKELAATRWSDALSSGGASRQWGGTRFGNRLIDSRRARVDVPPAVAVEPIRRIGGATGWYYANWLWYLRGWLDLLAGGVGSRHHLAAHMNSFRNFLHQFRIECGQVIRFAARHQPVIHDHFLVHPFRAGILKVHLYAFVRSHFATANDTRIDQSPGTMADSADRPASLEKRFYKFQCQHVPAQMIGIHHATGQHQGIKVFRVCLAQKDINFDFLAPIRAFPAFDFAFMGRNHPYWGTGVSQSFQRRK